MPEESDIQRKFAAICKRVHWRCTGARLAVYQYLDRNKKHPSVEMVWAEVRKTLPSISRDSVYRILNDFVEANLLARLDHIESARYDATMEHHGHFICRECGAISDFPVNAFDTLFGEFAPECGDVDHVELRIVGVCKKCLILKSEQS